MMSRVNLNDEIDTNFERSKVGQEKVSKTLDKGPVDDKTCQNAQC